MSEFPPGAVEVTQKLENFKHCMIDHPELSERALHIDGTVDGSSHIEWDGTGYVLVSPFDEDPEPIRIFFDLKAARHDVDRMRRKADVLERRMGDLEIKPIQAGWCGVPDCGLIVYADTEKAWCAAGHENPKTLCERPAPPEHKRWKGPGTNGVWVSPGGRHLILHADVVIWETGGSDPGPRPADHTDWIDPLLVRVAPGSGSESQRQIWVNHPDDVPGPYGYRGTVEQLEPHGYWSVRIRNPENRKGSIKAAVYAKRSQAVRALVLGPDRTEPPIETWHDLNVIFKRSPVPGDSPVNIDTGPE